MHDARSQIVIKQRNRLTAVLIILIGLDRNRRQRRVRSDVLWLAQKPVAGIKAALKQLIQRNLQTGCRAHRIEIHVMNVDIAVFMRGRHLRIQTIGGRIGLGQRAAVLQHHAHCAVAVDIGVLPLFIDFLRVLDSEVFQRFHQPVLAG